MPSSSTWTSLDTKTTPSSSSSSSILTYPVISLPSTFLKEKNPPPLSFQLNELMVIGPYLVHLVVMEGPWVYQHGFTTYSTTNTFPIPLHSPSYSTLSNLSNLTVTRRGTLRSSSSSSTSGLLRNKNISNTSNLALKTNMKKMEGGFHPPTTTWLVSQECFSTPSSLEHIFKYQQSILEWIKDCVFISIQDNMYPLKNLIFHDGNYQLFLERSDSNFFKKYTSQPTMTHLGTLKTCPYKYTAILCPIFWRKKKTAHTKKKKKYSLKEDDAQGVCKYQLKNWTSKSSSFSNPSLLTPCSLLNVDDKRIETPHESRSSLLASTLTSSPILSSSPMHPHFTDLNLWERSTMILKELKTILESKPSLEAWSM